MKYKNFFVSPLANLILYDALLVATPFLMVTNYLQSSLRIVSHLSLNLFGANVPYVVLFAGAFLLFLLIKYFKKLTPTRALGIAAVVAMFWLGQLVTDFYLDMSFFDIQQNWHYFAYSGFVFIMYRFTRGRGVAINKFVGRTFTKALVISAFDEGFQYFMSNRIFDVGDIAKDGWGTIIGLTIILFVVLDGRPLQGEKDFRHKKIGDYFKSTLSLFVFEAIFAFFLMAISSLVTSHQYIPQAVLIPAGVSIVVFVALHLTQFKLAKYAIIAVVAAGVVTQGFFHFKYKDDFIVSAKPGLVVYKGIPIVYFDAMIYPDGKLRLVDKKSRFTGGDMRTIMKSGGDVLLFGGGFGEVQTAGFRSRKYESFPQFDYDAAELEGMQMAPLDTKKACDTYNEIMKNPGEEKPEILFIIHNSKL